MILFSHKWQRIVTALYLDSSAKMIILSSIAKVRFINCSLACSQLATGYKPVANFSLALSLVVAMVKYYWPVVSHTVTQVIKAKK